MAESRIFETQDGSHSILSDRFGASYHSRYGAMRESRHVFIEAGLFPQMQKKQGLDILEVGFGTGLNALLTLRESAQRDFSIRYTALEAYPIDTELAAFLNYHRWMEDFPEAQGLFLQLHACPWEERQQILPGFSFLKHNMKFEAFRASGAFDLVFFDPFSPETQPELWESDVLESMFESMREGGFLVTYCAKGVVKRRLRAAGFDVEALPGPPGKREMTRAIRV